MFDTFHRTLIRTVAVLGGAATAAAGLTAIAAPAAHAANGVPRYDHVVVVMEENHSYSEIIGSGTGAPYINNTLAAGGALFTNSFAIEHPSEPNYLDIFSGSNQGITTDQCPVAIDAPNEGAQLLTAGDTFQSYNEDLPSVGSTVCTSGNYASKHDPWVNFQLAPSTSANHIPAADDLPFTSWPSSTNFASLPTVAWVTPNLQDDMHDGTITQGDTWLQTNIDAYAQWAKTHNSLLIVTWDEDDSSMTNQIPTIFYGAGVKTGQYSEHINHYSVLRTIEDMYGLPYAGNAASATPITDVWSTGTNTVTVTNPGNQTSTVGAGASLQIQASDSAAGQTLAYSATGLPAGLSVNSSTGLISGTLTTAGTSNVTVKATDTTGASGSASFTWTVNPAPNFSISVAPASGSVTAGSSTSTTVSTAAIGDFTGTVAFTASGLPTGATATFNPTSAAVGASSTLTFGTSSSTPAGTYNVTVTGTSGSLTHSATFALTVNPFTQDAVTVTDPGNQTGALGSGVSLQIQASDSAAGQTLTYSATGLPAGLSVNSSTGLISGTLTTAGTSTVTVTAVDNTGASGSTSFIWTVTSTANFSLSVSPTSASIRAGNSASATVSTTASGGFSGTVTFAASGLPAGATATFNPTSAAAGSSSTLTLHTSTSTPIGTYTITVTGTSGSLTHSVTFTLTVRRHR